MSECGALLSRPALARVLQSLLVAALKTSRGRAQKKGEDHGLESWPETFALGEGETSLGCDSLEMLWISAAVNEMFHLHEAGLELELLQAATFGGWMDAIEEAWSRGVSDLTFCTSGTTGAAKRCTHSYAFLSEEMDFLSNYFASARRIVGCSPAHHLYGFLFCAMLPDRLSLGVTTGLPKGNGSASGAVREGDLIVAVPEIWRWLERSVTCWPTGVQGVVSGGPCDREVLRSLVKQGLAGITEVYGSSETAGIGVRCWPNAGYRLMPQWSPRDTDAVPQTLIHSSGVRVDLMDRVAWSPDGTFEVAGRLDGAVQVGGVNVYPERIAERLRERPGVRTVDLRLRSAELGGRFEATIGLQEDATEDQIRAGLEAWMRLHLTVAEQPKTLAFARA
ncbi:acyl-CoA synthetase (AMP-forming)/AMP-acid ligase II [Terriglobus roseus DSM 18391]|uniref:Acyl-CoA synthetase (AMP-forming)/AMP-acid ligase II n=1 Tax=Terriglobus roseus (strain DSM 18391 / NRRL B-41598 / KBS 63) TaxID=926566 RepID=I3ZLG0_TERRK|nr:AMP-binding protein [Terriglobus roseus]AFL90078.1 acyl-CoA synthetase (AMP-forming)/AMP-acid ligase II [Terriglobus roseus DSM 18391]